MFENKIFEGIYYSRFIASYNNVGGNVCNKKQFSNWLASLTINGKHLNGDQIYEIYYLATNGKLELESNARKFLEEKPA